MTLQMRYDPERGVYRECRFCAGLGCLACPGEARKAYDAAQPTLVARFDMTSPLDQETLRAIIHIDRVRHAFSPGGGGHDELEAVARESYLHRLLQALRTRVAHTKHLSGGGSA